jgi:hypothetical protein
MPAQDNDSFGITNREITELALGDTEFAVDIAQAVVNCPKFRNLKFLPSSIYSPVSGDAFQMFLSALCGSSPVITAGNLAVLLSSGDEFEFSPLLSLDSCFMFHVSCFEERESAIDDETCKHICGIEEQNLQESRIQC